MLSLKTETALGDQTQDFTGTKPDKGSIKTTPGDASIFAATYMSSIRIPMYLGLYIVLCVLTKAIHTSNEDAK